MVVTSVKSASSQLDSTSWKNGKQRYRFKEMPISIQDTLHSLFPEYNSILIKKASSLSIPLHLDHSLFSSSYIAFPVTTAISTLMVYNRSHRQFFTKPILVTAPSRYTDFLSLEPTSSQPCYLLLFTSLQPSFHCTCGSEYCFDTILHSEHHHSDYQVRYVNQVRVVDLFQIGISSPFLLFRYVHYQVLQACIVLHRILQALQYV